MARPSPELAEGLALAGSPHRWGLAALLLVTVVWGTTFPAMKAMTGELQAVEIITLRFAVASAVLWPFLRGIRGPELRWGGWMGLVMFVATALQVSGLALTSSNRNAFITGLNVVLVPILASVLGQRLGWPVLAGATLSVFGMSAMFYEAAPWGLGDTLTLASAFCYAVYVLALEQCGKAMARAGQHCRPERLAALQSLAMLGLGFAAMCVQPGTALATLPARVQAHAWPLLYLGLVASAGMVWLQAWGQARVRAVEAALMYSLEPVFAALTAVYYIHELMSGRALLGAAVIVLGVMVSQWTGRMRSA
ncbi:transporter [Pseudorhodoferax aquiterrae]|uniref:Transporter n=1 Tax=Pseudorhodoferax aquiterrae TaxID=747304 RepID=A0ABQ3FVQ5_9BURK|nr:DMT family transporter [Pseudorhodoferax aquiterrae]GHC70995.1 transporter [Pseudorhodoferax aquiterrae]